MEIEAGQWQETGRGTLYPPPSLDTRLMGLFYWGVVQIQQDPDPWGVVRADCGEGIGIGYAEIDLDYVRTVRASIPVAQHRRI